MSLNNSMSVVRSRLRESGRMVLLAGALLLPFGSAACSHMPWTSSGGTPMMASPRMPAAQGAVSIKDADNGNVKLAVSVKHMAPPEKVATGASSYVVWLKPLATGNENEAPQNLGALAVNKDEEGNFDTTTSYRQFDLFVTAEPQPGSTSPTGEQLLSTTIRR
jgi:hypothetical protein